MDKMDQVMGSGTLSDHDPNPESESLVALPAALTPTSGGDLESPAPLTHPKRKSSPDLEESQEWKRQRGPDNPQIQHSSPTSAPQNSGMPLIPTQNDAEKPKEIHEGLDNGVTTTTANQSVGKVETNPSDTFKEELDGILGDNGGVVLPQLVPRLDALMGKEQGLKHRWTLLTVVELSNKECQLGLILGNGLKTLERWLVEANEAHKPQFLARIIECISILPVEIGMLRKFPISKTIGPLRKHEFVAVRKAAKSLVDKWKGMSEKTMNERSGTKVAPTAQKVPLEARKAGKPKNSSQPVQMGKLVAVDDSKMFNPTPPPRRTKKAPRRVKATAAVKSTPKITSTAAMVRAMVSGVVVLDGDKGVPTSKAQLPGQTKSGSNLGVLGGLRANDQGKIVKEEHQRKLQGAGQYSSRPLNLQTTDAMQIVESNEQVQGPDAGNKGSDILSGPSGGVCVSQDAMEGVEFSETQTKSEEQDAMPWEPANVSCLSKQANCSVDSKVEVPASSVPQLNVSLKSTETSNRLPDSVDANKKPLSLGGILGASGFRLGGLGSNQQAGKDNRVGSLNSPFLPQRAWGSGWRATTVKVPDIPANVYPLAKPVSRTTKRKRVKWAMEKDLTSIRWFKKDDPPECVKQDSFYTPEEFAAQEYLDARQNPFSSAARLEHLSESEAIKASRRLGFQEHAQAMTKQVAWKRPPTLELKADWKVAFGEGSKEKGLQARREEDVVPMHNNKNTIIPSNPMEPDTEPVHRGKTTKIPYNAPVTDDHQGSKSQTGGSEAQGVKPQSSSKGVAPVLVQTQSHIGSLQQGCIPQNHFITHQVVQQRPGQPQAVLLLQSSGPTPSVIIPPTASQPMVVAPRANQPMLTAQPHQPVVISGHPQPIQVQPPPMQIQVQPGAFMAGRPLGMVQHLVLSGPGPGITTQHNHFGQQVFAIPGGVVQTNLQPQTADPQRVLPQGHGLQNTTSNVPGRRS